jgi:AraC-like DNA-binding protein
LPARRSPPRPISSAFKREFGETPHRYLQRRRIERAADLLRESDRLTHATIWVLDQDEALAFYDNSGNWFSLTQRS